MWLCDWAANDDRKTVNQAAIKAIVLASYPNEAIPGLRKKILTLGLTDYILYYSSLGTMTAHAEVDWNDIKILNSVGSGVSGTVYRYEYFSIDLTTVGQIIKVKKWL
jgi:hypothetical protein